MLHGESSKRLATPRNTKDKKHLFGVWFPSVVPGWGCKSVVVPHFSYRAARQQMA